MLTSPPDPDVMGDSIPLRGVTRFGIAISTIALTTRSSDQRTIQALPVQVIAQSWCGYV